MAAMSTRAEPVPLMPLLGIRARWTLVQSPTKPPAAASQTLAGPRFLFLICHHSHQETEGGAWEERVEEEKGRGSQT